MKYKSDYMMCSSCGDFVKKYFVKKYQLTGICLCKQCARKLQDELNDYFDAEDKTSI